MNAREMQDAVYRAEHAALDGLGQRWTDVRQARAYVEDLCADPACEAWVEVFGEVEVQRLRSSTWAGIACTELGVVKLKRLEERILLHEMAHMATPGTGHGQEFVGVYLHLVRARMGFMAYGALLAAYRAEGVFDV